MKRVIEKEGMHRWIQHEENESDLAFCDSKGKEVEAKEGNGVNVYVREKMNFTSNS